MPTPLATPEAVADPVDEPSPPPEQPSPIRLAPRRLSYAAAREALWTAAPFALAGALLIKIAWPLLSWWLFQYFFPDSYYSHAPLVPIMIVAMLRHQRARLAAVPKRMEPAALCLLVPATLALIYLIKADARALAGLALMACMWSSVWLAFGWRLMRAAWFPLLFLLVMQPLPGPLLNDATQGLQSISTGLASRLLDWTRFENVRQGNLIAMSDYTLFVDVPCSGFKTLLALFTFNAFLAAMLDGPVARRVLLFALCAPTALLVNALRIALIGIVGECMGVSAAHVFHDYSGYLTLALGFAALFAIAKFLGCRKFAGLAIF